MATHPGFLWADLFRQKKNENRQLLEVLKDNVLFRTLNRRELSYLSTLLYERVYEPGEPVFRQNDRGIGMYIIAKGRIEIKTDNAHGEVHVTNLDQGSFFGEIALVDEQNVRTASAFAVERSTLIGFFNPDLQTILDRKPSMGVKILHQLSSVIARRLLETTDRITQLKRALKEERSASREDAVA